MREGVPVSGTPSLLWLFVFLKENCNFAIVNNDAHP